MYEDILIEVARTMRECEEAVHAKMARRRQETQLGLAFVGLEFVTTNEAPIQPE